MISSGKYIKIILYHSVTFRNGELLMEKSLNGRTLVWAHRGASAYAPENTLPAFALAVEMKADGVELDVHLTKDGEVLVCHNDTINDTSDKSGRIPDMTLAEIREANFAFRYHDTKYTDKYGFVTAPTLDEVYELLAPTGLTVNVELKSGEDELLSRCIRLAKEYKMTDKVYYSDFNHVDLMRLHEVSPDVPTAPLYFHRLGKVWDYAGLIGASAIHPDFGQLYEVPETVRECHARGIRVNPWTVDSEEHMKKLTELGVDALITDLPDVARRIVEGVDN